MTRIVFFNTGWMKRYDGLTSSDTITGGGKYVNKNKFGHEIFNFHEDSKHVIRGFVQVKGDLNINRLGASKDDEFVDDTLVIWTAKDSGVGVVIVGWYKNAKVYRSLQTHKTLKHNGRALYYNVEATANNCHLLPVDKRNIKVPKRVKGGMGQALVWYADAPAIELSL
jgi:5-methylcytosine-specific restriction enzyme A